MTQSVLMDLFTSKEITMKIRNEYLWLVLLVAVIAGGPLLSIWALNTLFPVLAIPYTLETWAAMALVGGVFQSLKIGKKD
jgi:hypothetical protein